MFELYEGEKEILSGLFLVVRQQKEIMYKQRQRFISASRDFNDKIYLKMSVKHTCFCSPLLHRKVNHKVNWFVPGSNWDLAILAPTPMLREVSDSLHMG